MCRGRSEGLGTPRSSSVFLQRYTLLDTKLGEGSFGTVREAECRLTGKRVAVKIYHKAHLSARGWRSLQREQQALSATAHRGVVELLGWYEDASAAYVVLEKLSGVDLLQRLEGEADGCSEAEVADIAWQVLQALQYLHSRRISHRDLKLENVMLEYPSRTAKLVDFGFSANIEDGQTLTERCGSLQYVAPEVLSGEGYDEKCDIYSLGAIVYALLTTEALFDGEDAGEIQRKNASGAVDWSLRFSEHSEETQEFVRWLLALAPASRPSAAEALQHPWLGRRRPLVAAPQQEQPACQDEADRGSKPLEEDSLEDSLCTGLAQQLCELTELSTGARMDVGMATLLGSRLAEAKAHRGVEVQASSKRVAPWWVVSFCSSLA